MGKPRPSMASVTIAERPKKIRWLFGPKSSSSRLQRASSRASLWRRSLAATSWQACLSAAESFPGRSSRRADRSLSHVASSWLGARSLPITRAWARVSWDSLKPRFARIPSTSSCCQMVWAISSGPKVRVSTTERLARSTFSKVRLSSRFCFSLSFSWR